MLHVGVIEEQTTRRVTVEIIGTPSEVEAAISRAKMQHQSYEATGAKTMSRIALIKAIRAANAMGLKDAKDLVDSFWDGLL